MAPTPIVADGYLDIAYAVAGLTHHTKHFVMIDGSGVTATIISSEPGNTNITPADAVTALWGLARAMYHTDVTGVGWTLYKYVSGAAIPQNSGTTALAGTASLFNQTTAMLTITFADANNKRVNSCWLEQANPPTPGKRLVSSTPAPLTALIDSYATPFNAFDPGFWIVGRGSSYIARLISWTTDTNDHLLRQRFF